MPAWRETTQILLQLNRICRDLSWLKAHPHFAELRQPGHWDTIDEQCAAWAGVGDLMARHLEDAMLLESREAIRASVVVAAESGLPLRWQIGGELEHAKVALVRVQDGRVLVFLPARVPVPA